MKADLLLPLWLSHHLEILAWQYWQHPSAGSLVWERHPTGQLCPGHSCRGCPPSAGQAIPTPHGFKARLPKFPTVSCRLLLLPGCLTGCASSRHGSSTNQTMCPPGRVNTCSLFSFTPSVAGSFLAAHLFAGPPTPTFSAHQTPLKRKEKAPGLLFNTSSSIVEILNASICHKLPTNIQTLYYI